MTERGSVVVIFAPACTSTLPSASVKVGVATLAPYRPPLVNWLSVILAAAATRLRTSTWLEPENTMPLRLAIITVPSALICPWICEGRACGSLTLFSTLQADCCWNSTVVCLPTLKVSQFRIARSAVCRIATLVRPFDTVCTGALALSQPAVSESVSTLRPPSARPSGTDAGSFAAACRAAACAPCCAAIACAARLRLPMERCSCALACCCCACVLVRLDAGMPLGSRPVAMAVFCAMFFCAIQPALNARCACAVPSRPPAASAIAMARAIGALRRSCLARGWCFACVACLAAPLRPPVLM